MRINYYEHTNYECLSWIYAKGSKRMDFHLNLQLKEAFVFIHLTFYIWYICLYIHTRSIEGVLIPFYVKCQLACSTLKRTTRL